MTLTWTSLSNVNFLCMPGEQLPQDWTEMFDFVILNDVFHDAYVEDGILTEVRRVLKSDRFCSFLWVCYLVFPWIFLVVTARGVVLARATKSGGCGFRLVNVGEMNIDVMQKRIVFQIWFILASYKLNPGTTCKSYQVLWNNKFYSINWPHNFTDILPLFKYENIEVLFIVGKRSPLHNFYTLNQWNNNYRWEKNWHCFYS